MCPLLGNALSVTMKTFNLTKLDLKSSANRGWGFSPVNSVMTGSININKEYHWSLLCHNLKENVLNTVTFKILYKNFCENEIKDEIIILFFYNDILCGSVYFRLVVCVTADAFSRFWVHEPPWTANIRCNQSAEVCI